MSPVMIQYVGMWASIGVTLVTGLMALGTFLTLRSGKEQLRLAGKQLDAFRESVTATVRYNLSIEAQALNRLLIEYPETQEAFADPNAYDHLHKIERLRADTITEVWLLHYETLFEAWPVLSGESKRLYENAVRDCIRHYPLLKRVLREDACSEAPVWCTRLREMALRSDAEGNDETIEPSVA